MNVRTNATHILLSHDAIAIPASNINADNGPICGETIATLLMNLSYYGRALSMEGYEALVKLTEEQAAAWWKDVETELKDITGENRKMGDFVVYKNFPGEVLAKSDAEYWLPQILMYWGFPTTMFTEPVLPRQGMGQQPTPKVLRKAKAGTLQEILGSHLRSPARWKSAELAEVEFLAERYPINFATLVFKENMVMLAVALMESGRKVSISTATDVLRLAAGLSDGDVSLRDTKKMKFKSFKKPMRRFLVNILEGCGNLEEDVARRAEVWKRLFSYLHPGDFRKSCPKVCEVMDKLYKGQLATFNTEVESLILRKNPLVLQLLATRPGDFRRRLVHMVNLFGEPAVKAFTQNEVLSKLTVAQIVGLRRHLETVNERTKRCFPPKGNWAKLKLGEPRRVQDEHQVELWMALGEVLAQRVPSVKVLAPETAMVKLPNNGEEGPYTRGTTFPIPEGTDFIRTASYWNVNRSGYTWFDNGWNFFSHDWKPLGACCWSEAKFPRPSYRSWWSKPTAADKEKERQEETKVGAVFSGDPTIAKGKACQMIDLYPAQLRAAGVRYAVWSILCYSGLTFSKAEEVFAAFQWGKDANRGKLFEPARCQLAIPLKGETLTKYVVLIDFEKNEMVYLDASLKSSRSSAAANGPLLSETMPAFMEYINGLPSVHDLFRESVGPKGEAQILYTDKDAELTGGPAYVFRQENKGSLFKPVDLNGLLG